MKLLYLIFVLDLFGNKTVLVKQWQNLISIFNQKNFWKELHNLQTHMPVHPVAGTVNVTV
jgi:hypothetical protein